MEVGPEIDDDICFADLSKQICLLILDDEDDPVPHCSPISFQALAQRLHPNAQSLFSQEQIQRREICKGTGVFLPRLSQPRRKFRRGGRVTSSNTRQQIHSDSSRGLRNGNKVS